MCGKKKTSTVTFLKNRNYNIATYTESDFFCITFVDLGRAKINCALKRKEKLPQKNNAQRIEILQKRVNRIVDKSYYNIYRIYRTYFKKLKLLKFQDNNLMHLDQTMFASRNAMFPRKFENIITINNPINCYNTRQTPLVVHYVKQISGNSPYSIKVLQILFLFHLKFLALHHRHFFIKSLKHILLVTTNSVIKSVQ